MAARTHPRRQSCLQLINDFCTSRNESCLALSIHLQVVNQITPERMDLLQWSSVPLFILSKVQTAFSNHEAMINFTAELCMRGTGMLC